MKREAAETSASAPAVEVESQIARAFELVLSRPPTTTEAERLRRLYDDSIAAAIAVTSLDGSTGVAALSGQGGASALHANGTAGAATDREVGAASRAMRSVAAAILNLDAAFVR